MVMSGGQSSFACANCSSLRPQIITSCPLLASLFAKANPIPDPPPVIRIECVEMVKKEGIQMDVRSSIEIRLLKIKEG